MAVRLSWNFGTLENIKSFRIESSSTFEGPYTEVATVDFPNHEYTDNLGSNDTYYRMVVVFEDGTESEPTLPKKIMAPAVCRIFGYILHVTGRPIEGEVIRFSVYRPTLPQVHPGFVLNTIVEEVTTGPDGYFEVDLVHGAVVDIQCDRLGLHYRSKVVPAIDVKPFDEWLNEA